MSTLQNAKEEILTVCEKHGVKLEAIYDENNVLPTFLGCYIEVVYKTDEVTGSTRLYTESNFEDS
jgi:hypothetical protein